MVFKSCFFLCLVYFLSVTELACQKSCPHSVFLYPFSISHSTANNQRMWQLGDCAEVFIKTGKGVEEYWEIHVTPNKHLMDMHIPAR